MFRLTPLTRLVKGEQLPEAVSALTKALRVRALRPDEGMVVATDAATRNLEGLVKAFLDLPVEEGQNELAGALSAVDHVNRLAWRYFVQKFPYEGESVMQEVGAMQGVGKKNVDFFVGLVVQESLTKWMRFLVIAREHVLECTLWREIKV